MEQTDIAEIHSPPGSDTQTSAVATVDIRSLTIADCAGVADRIRSELASNGKIVLTLAQCEEIDTAGAQLLAIIRCDEGIASRISIEGLSDVVSDLLALLGLSSLMTAH